MKITTMLIFFFCNLALLAFRIGANESVPLFTTQYAIYYHDLNNINLNLEKSKENYLENVKNYTKLLKLHSEFKNFEISIGEKLINKVENGKALSGDELYFFSKTLHLFYKFALKMNDFSKYFNVRKNYRTAKFNLNNQDDQISYNQIFYLNGQVQFIDHALKMNLIYYKANDNLRRIVKKSLDASNSEETKIQNELISLINGSLALANNRDFYNKIVLYSKIKIEPQKFVNIENDIYYQYYELYNNQISKDILQGKTDFRIDLYESKDKFINFFNNFTNWISSVFGNISGSIKWRTGRLYQNPTATLEIEKKLKPLDILLEKSPFVLTDKFIPGHFGHAALYLGTKSQLEELGIWNHPSILPYQEDIINGKTILEAVRPGVRLSTVSDFMNIDELLIVRKNDVYSNIDNVIENYLRGFDQLGKPYDFNFDVETLDKIVCSELIYIVFGEVNWPTKYRLGRTTISPDDISEITFFKDTKFDIKHFVIGDSNQKVIPVEKETLAKELNYVLRAENGGPIINENDPTNTFFKLTEQCYNLVSAVDSNQIIKECKSIYTLKYYAENSIEEKL